MSGKRYIKWTPNMEAVALMILLDGATLKDAGAMFGVSAERFRQVTNKTIRRLCHPSRLDEALPDGARGGLSEVRQHADFWRRRALLYVAKEGVA